MTVKAVESGLDLLIEEDFARLKGCRVAILCNQASVDSRLEHIIDIIRNQPEIKLVRVLAPEHGLYGALQDQISLPEAENGERLELINLYGKNESSLWPQIEWLSDIDVLIADLQDVGSRYYTFYTTLAFCMIRAAEADCSVLVLDRPNPIGAEAIEGPMLDRSMQSFVGYFDIPVRHGMTLGELALYIREIENIDVELNVLDMRGWKRSMHFSDTGLPWVLPSPNMTSPDTALVYPGCCLFEGTNLSEGRGTTRPFELFGAPWLDSESLLDKLKADSLEGVSFRKAVFQPTFHKYAEKACQGLQIHVSDLSAFRPWLTAVDIIRHVWSMHSEFDWYRGVYEFVHDRLAIDLLFGNPEIRKMIESNADLDEFADFDMERRKEFDVIRHRIALYPF